VENKLQIASQLLETAQDSLVIRGLSDYTVSELPHIGLGALSKARPRADAYVGNGFPHRGLGGRRVSIYLLSLCKVPDGDHKKFFEVRYTSEDDATRWYKSNQIDVHILRPSESASPESAVSSYTYAVGECLQVWSQHIPPWVSTDGVVVCDEDENDHFVRRSSAHIRFLAHFTRLHGLLMKRGATTIGAWETEDLVKRLGRFLKERNQQWEGVIG